MHAGRQILAGVACTSTPGQARLELYLLQRPGHSSQVSTAQLLDYQRLAPQLILVPESSKDERDERPPVLRIILKLLQVPPVVRHRPRSDVAEGAEGKGDAGQREARGDGEAGPLQNLRTEVCARDVLEQAP